MNVSAEIEQIELDLIEARMMLQELTRWLLEGDDAGEPLPPMLREF